jgi:hypothetical protein
VRFLLGGFFSRRGEGGGWRSGGSVTLEQSREETMGSALGACLSRGGGIWPVHGARGIVAGGAAVSRQCWHKWLTSVLAGEEKGGA